MRLDLRSHLAAVLLASFAATARAAPPMIGGCQVFPSNNYWNTPVDQLPLHPSSTVWQNNMRTKSNTNSNPATLWPDWGNVLADNYGIPFITSANAPPATITFEVPEESDDNPYLIPANAPVEGGAGSGGDMHVLAIDTAGCKLYELYSATQTSSTTWNAFSGAIFPLNSNALRPEPWTSADAAGFAVMPGLVRWDEVAAGEINHAIRFTAQNIWGSIAGGGHKYFWPARHWSGGSTNSNFPPMGARFRLRASFDIAGYDPRTQVILRAMKKYGLVLADGGSNWFFSGTSDTNWPDIVLSQLKSIVVSPAVPGSNPVVYDHKFEVVDTGLLQMDPNSAQAVQVPGAPTGITVTPGNGQATFAFTAPPDGGKPIVTYRATCNPGGKIGMAPTSPVTVSGLSNGTPYTCSIAAANVTGAGPASATISVTPVQAVLFAEPPNVDFGPSRISSASATRTITVTNAGSGNTSALGENMTGANVGSFSRTSDCDGETLGAGTHCTIAVTFNPPTTGAHTASLTLSGATTSPITILLSGTGINVPGAPMIGSAVVGSGKAWIFFAAPAADGGSPITSYKSNCAPGIATANATYPPIFVTGLNDGTPYTCSVTATNDAGDGVPSADVTVTPSATPALGLIGVQSRKSHTGVADFDVPINSTVPIDGPVSMEPRIIGAGHRIVFQFNRPITDPGTAGAFNAVASPLGMAFAAKSGNDVVVTLTGITENQRVRVTLTNVNGVGVGGSAAASLGFMMGDVNATGKVNASDISAVKAHVGQAASGDNFRFDLDASGNVTPRDVSVLKARSGLVMP